MAQLRSGKLPFIEHGAAPLLSKALAHNRLIFTSQPAAISRSGPVIVTIGTPVDEFLNPVRQAVQDCIDALLPYLADDQLLVLRSTVYPGMTDWLDAYLKRQGRKLKVAFCRRAWCRATVSKSWAPCRRSSAAPRKRRKTKRSPCSRRLRPSSW